MAKKTFIVAKPNLMLKQDVDGVRKMVKMPVGAEYICEEKDVKVHIKSMRLVSAKDAKKLTAVENKST